MPAEGPARTQSRVLWADLAKGACILLVVLHHTLTKHYAGLVPADLAAVGRLWWEVTDALKPVRMPLFFVLSGLFAASAIRRPWASGVRRIASPYYVYVVWLLLLGGLFAVERSLPMNRTQDARELVLDLLYASTGLWFLYALAVYFVLAKLLVRVPAPALLLAAGVLAASTSWLPLDEVNRVSVLAHFVWFVLGCRSPDLVRRFADLRGAWLLPALTLAYGGLVLALPAAGFVRSVDLVLLSLLGVPWGIRCAVWLSRLPALASGLSWVGRRTLPIYVLHMPVLALLHHSPVDVVPADSPGRFVMVAAYPLLATGMIAAAALLLHAGLVRVGLGSLFALPWPAGSGGRRLDQVHRLAGDHQVRVDAAVAVVEVDDQHVTEAAAPAHRRDHAAAGDAVVLLLDPVAPAEEPSSLVLHRGSPAGL